MAEKPTDTAKIFFSEAIMAASSFTNTKNNFDLGQAVQKMSQGLYFQSIGLRATYILLEEVKQLLQRQSAQPGRTGPPPGGVSLSDR